MKFTYSNWVFDRYILDFIEHIPAQLIKKIELKYDDGEYYDMSPTVYGKYGINIRSMNWEVFTDHCGRVREVRITFDLFNLKATVNSMYALLVHGKLST